MEAVVLEKIQVLAGPDRSGLILASPLQWQSPLRVSALYVYTGAQYTDGTRASMLFGNGLVGDYTFAARLRGE